MSETFPPDAPRRVPPEATVPSSPADPSPPADAPSPADTPPPGTPPPGGQPGAPDPSDVPPSPAEPLPPSDVPPPPTSAPPSYAGFSSEPAPAAPRRPLRRSRGDRKIAGVCAGLARYADVDPLVFRVTIAVLALFGGIGLLIYGLVWLLVPEDGAPESEGEALLRGRADGGTIAAVLLSLAGLAAVGGLLGHGPGPAGLLVLALVAVLLVVATRLGGAQPWATRAAGHSGGSVGPPAPGSSGGAGAQGAAGQPGDTGERPTDPGAPGWGPGNAASAAYPSYFAAGAPPDTTRWDPSADDAATWPEPPRPRRERSPLAVLTISVALLTVGFLLLWGLLSGVDLGARRVAAAVLIVIGAGLLVGARWGRARILIALGLIVCLPLIGSTIGDRSPRGGAGERRWQPASVAALAPPYRLGAGSAELDLRAIDPAGARIPVAARVGVGELVVLVPPTVDLIVDAEVGAGEVRVVGREARGGLGVDHDVTVPAEGVSRGALELDLEMGMGSVEVRRAAS